MSEPPVFTLDQPDGRRLRVDLSVATMHSDFAFTATELASGRVTYFDAYHTGERFLFLDVLHRIAHDHPSEVVLADVARIRDDLVERTVGMTATSRSQTNFDDLLNRLPAALAAQPTSSTYAPSSDRDHSLRLTPTTEGLTISWQRGDTPRPRDRTVFVPAAQLWRFAAGMIWRSYDERNDYPFLTRISTAAYGAALSAFESAIKAWSDTL